MISNSTIFLTDYRAVLPRVSKDLRIPLLLSQGHGLRLVSICLGTSLRRLSHNVKASISRVTSIGQATRG